ncbi:MAG: sulfatase family protein, partial [Planctomycetota bacterium]
GTLSLTFGGCFEGSSTSAKFSKRPNVLFFFADQLRADACSVYGGKNIKTPHIDKLASEGIRFANGLSTTPLCTPYRGMVQTGRYPTHSGIVANWFEINPNQRCIAHIFADAGYHTGFIGKWHLAAGARKYAGKFNPDKKAVEAHRKRNPETEFVPPGPDRVGYQHWEAFNFHCTFKDWWYYRDEPKKVQTREYETDGQANLAIKFMQKHRNSNQPFFLMVAPHPPHPPFKPRWAPEGYLDKIKKDLYFSPNVPKDHPRRTNQLAARCYYAMSRNIDDNVGRIMKFLDESGLSENTIVVFTSDHGEQHGSHNRTNKMVPYAESVDVPLIVCWKGHISAGTTSDELYTPLDHMTTLCGLTGLKPPKTADGVDLSKVVLGKGKLDRDAVLIANYTSHWDYFQTGTTWPEWRGVRTKRYTYVKWLKGWDELFDNKTDPHQMNNLVKDPKYFSVRDEMRRKLKKLLAEAHDEFLPGTAYGDWYDDERNLLRTALGPV